MPTGLNQGSSHLATPAIRVAMSNQAQANAAAKAMPAQGREHCHLRARRVPFLYPLCATWPATCLGRKARKE
eukprot:1995679-Amphidinium_carterae.1